MGCKLKGVPSASSVHFRVMRKCRWCTQLPSSARQIIFWKYNIGENLSLQPSQSQRQSPPREDPKSQSQGDQSQVTQPINRTLSFITNANILNILILESSLCCNENLIPESKLQVKINSVLDPLHYYKIFQMKSIGMRAKVRS